MCSHPSDIETILESGLKVPALPELFSQSVRLREATSMATGEIFRWDASNGKTYLVKTFARSSCFSRFLFGHVSIEREWRMLNFLCEKNLDFAPLPIAKVGAYTIVMEFIPGKKLENANRYRHTGQEIPQKETYLSLKDLLKRLHNAGIAHGDFRRANILIQPDGQPRLIDWATARRKDAGLRFLHKQLLKSDNYSLVRILTDVYPDLVTEEERIKAKPGFLLSLGRYLRQNLYRRFIKKHHHNRS